MNFDKAWEIMENEAAGKAEDKKTPVNIWIDFKGGSASLLAPRFFKDIAGTKETVKLAWNTFCKHNEDLSDSIEDIHIIIEGAENREEKEQRFSA